MEQPLKPDVVEAELAEEAGDEPDVTEPSKLIRIASMTRAMAWRTCGSSSTTRQRALVTVVAGVGTGGR